MKCETSHFELHTSFHPFWSVDRQDWIPLGQLYEFERVQTRRGEIRLLSRVASLTTDVYNIEVDCDHVYEVGDVGVLVHNACGKNLGEAMSGNAGARRMWDKGYEAHHLIAEGLKGGKWDDLRKLDDEV